MILEQFSRLPISRFEIVLQSPSEAVLPALIGSTLRGAFGHALKAISCSVPHQNCEICLLSEVCLYPIVFEPTSAGKFRDLPRPFVFQPPVPPLTREISETKTLKLRVAENGKISFGLTLIGDAAKKLPYFIYAFELMARHGLGADRHSFALDEVFNLTAEARRISIYNPQMKRVRPFAETTLADFVGRRLDSLKPDGRWRIQLRTPLRIRRNRRLLEKITFAEFFKQCSLRLKLLAENYGRPLEYDYQALAAEAERTETDIDGLWRHASTRCSNRQDENLELDGMLGEIEFVLNQADIFLPFIVAGEFLNIGSASSLGLGKYEISD